MKLIAFANNPLVYNGDNKNQKASSSAFVMQNAIMARFLAIYPTRASGSTTLIPTGYNLTKECEGLAVGNINPINLKGLKQALFVLHSLTRGKTTDQIVDTFDGDKQLVEIWTNFLIHKGWIERIESGEFTPTEKGREWQERFEESVAS